MKTKDYEPIHFRFFQSDVEKIMWFLENARINLKDSTLERFCVRIQEDFKHKIDIHKDKGEWI